MYLHIIIDCFILHILYSTHIHIILKLVCVQLYITINYFIFPYSILSVYLHHIISQIKFLYCSLSNTKLIHFLYSIMFIILYLFNITLLSINNSITSLFIFLLHIVFTIQYLQTEYTI